MDKLLVKSLNEPEEVRNFEKGKLELITVAGKAVGRATLEPGWRWADHVKPLVNTASCEAPHFQYQISGTLKVVMDDGTEKLIKAGEVSWIPPGHDAWVVGNEPVVIVDFQGMTHYAQELREHDNY